MAHEPPSLANLISSYPILSSLTQYVSTLDLYHVALTSRSNHASILGSSVIFDRLKRLCLCDGRGLARRQNFTGPHRIHYWKLKLKQEPRIDFDEPIEVRLFNLKCMWCKRRHRPEVEWWNEATELKRAGTSGNPFYDLGYPNWMTDDDGKYPTPYPKLGYDRPGEDSPAPL
ncbi:hypothetical protein K4K49_004969 [Colletotrichum sp. SAR 10_70]|nr:hypothetical protein K4K50_008034 [Colletotrichum sp. SAR 10_71]KAI8189467.1 hypothetical protein K4K51_004636 [Colletotrichum sp. SAR 10_75]KAI8197769.1 hypothetical protein K4K49_004969 [Colletotrichum sp. SAR 10_70]KAI8215466.1 hypothetical protein K4K52_006225 [Colletotrichum sp. SAR 10_76]KAI8231335.1 hypothetical protein K4K54_013235 [Colletotrichum sp. SAR 10_86]KAJ5006786.1 hypothetical protein K4K48_002516 [Colletotrichum sp. SAR 10_66]